MRLTLMDGGINWNWYLCADFDLEQKTCHIFYYDRWHKYEYRGSKHPKYDKGHTFKILESEKDRQVYGIKLDGVEYLVSNPDYVFSYRDISAYVPED